jgi:hypothetical protein
MARLLLMDFLQERHPHLVLKQAGDKGHGVFATRKLEKGFKVVDEAPLFTIDTPFAASTQASIEAEYKKLPDDKKLIYNHMRNDHDPICNCSRGTFHGSMIQETRHRYTACYEVLPWFNHACVPNASWEKKWDKSIKRNRIIITLLRDVKKDEEICIDYYPHIAFLKHGERQARYKEFGSFKECKCDLCRQSSVDRDTSDMRRTLMCGLIFTMTGCKEHSTGSMSPVCHAARLNIGEKDQTMIMLKGLAKAEGIELRKDGNTLWW